MMLQKQSPSGVMLKRCSQKFLKIHRKTPVPESLWCTGVFCEFCEIFKNTFSYRTPRVTASDASIVITITAIM